MKKIMIIGLIVLSVFLIYLCNLDNKVYYLSLNGFYKSNNIDNFADKMYEAIKNRTSKISENAQNYAKQQFSTQRNVDEIIKIYEKIGKNKWGKSL